MTRPTTSELRGDPGVGWDATAGVAGHNRCATIRAADLTLDEQVMRRIDEIMRGEVPRGWTHSGSDVRSER
jgi:hypothetical protein